MPAYSFNARFERPIERGEKRHTIRGKRRSRPRVGQTFHGYVGMRTKKCRKILEAPITKVEDIKIDVGTDRMRVWVEDQELTRDELDQLAKKDGFQDEDEMFRFWRFNHKPGFFFGDIIHWDYDRRVKNVKPKTREAA